MRIKIKMNKKGDIAVALLVIMIAVLLVFTVWTFIKNSANKEVNFLDIGVVGKVYYDADSTEFLIRDTGQVAFIKSYSDMMNDKKQDIFKKTPEERDKIMGDLFTNWFNEETKNDIKVENQGKPVIAVKNLDVGVKVLSSFSLPVDNENELPGVEYKTDVIVKFYLEDYNLYNPEFIKEKSEECLKNGDKSQIEACLSKDLPLLSSTFDKDIKTVHFSTINSYLIEDEEPFQKITFEYPSEK